MSEIESRPRGARIRQAYYQIADSDRTHRRKRGNDMDAKTKGAWVVHHMNKLQQVTQAAEYENIAVAGKIGTLLSALSTSETSRLTTAQVKSLAKAAGISTALELPALLEQLEGRKLID